MQTLCDDIRYSLATLWRQRLLTLVAILTLALGMGLNVAIFSAVSGILWNTLPYPGGERLISIWGANPQRQFNQINVSVKETEMLAKATSLARIVPYRFVQAGLRTTGSARSVDAVEAGDGFFDILGHAPAMGRKFEAAEQLRTDQRVVILSASLWKTEFGGDPGVVGKELVINSRTHTVIGVMPPGFDFLYRNIGIYLPLALTPEQRNDRGMRSFRAVALIQPGTTLSAATDEMRAIAKGFQESAPDIDRGWTVRVHPLELEVIPQGARLSMQTLFWAVMGVLLIACTNIASLQLARGILRQRELAIRASLGAGQGRIARLLLTESILLSMLGGLAGIVFAWWGLPVLRSLAPPGFPRMEMVTLNPTVLAYAFGLCLLCGLIAGAAPAWMLTRGELARTLHEGGRGGTSSRRAVLQGLVALEVALAMVLLTVTGLLVRSLSSSLLGDPGFDKSGLLTASVSLSNDAYPDARSRAAFFENVASKIRQDRRILTFSAVQTIPLGGSSSWTPITVEGRNTSPGERDLTGFMAVLPRYFETLRVPLLAGRDFDERDTGDSERVAVVNQTMAQRFWPDDRVPLGRKLFLAGGRETRPITVIGVTRDVRHNGTNQPARPEMYLPVAQTNNSRMFLIARAANDPYAIAQAFRDAVGAVDRNQAIAQIDSMEEIIDRRLAGPRATVQILGVVTVLAVLLAGIGIYGVLSYLTSQRAREIGIRVALGAQPGSVVRLVLTRGVALAGLGLVAGTLGAYALTPLVRSLLDGVEPHDPRSFSVATAVLLIVSLLACANPVRRALRLDPAKVLREE
ncbi:MAG: ABC transporter permease [Bryobacterales bacterium]|nr:ABC transporter permease [Bryobacterales bacterium]